MSWEQVDKQAVAWEPLITFLHISILKFWTLHSEQWTMPVNTPGVIKHLREILARLNGVTSTSNRNKKDLAIFSHTCVNWYKLSLQLFGISVYTEYNLMAACHREYIWSFAFKKITSCNLVFGCVSSRTTLPGCQNSVLPCNTHQCQMCCFLCLCLHWCSKNWAVRQCRESNQGETGNRENRNSSLRV